MSEDKKEIKVRHENGRRIFTLPKQEKGEEAILDKITVKIKRNHKT